MEDFFEVARLAGRTLAEPQFQVAVRDWAWFEIPGRNSMSTSHDIGGGTLGISNIPYFQLFDSARLPVDALVPLSSKARASNPGAHMHPCFTCGIHAPSFNVNFVISASSNSHIASTARYGLIQLDSIRSVRSESKRIESSLIRIDLDSPKFLRRLNLVQVCQNALNCSSASEAAERAVFCQTALWQGAGAE